MTHQGDGLHREAYRVIYSRDETTISTNIEGFRWPTREEKIAGLLEAGLIDEAKAKELRDAAASGEVGA